MKKSQLKEAIKQIVRQAINERKQSVQEVAPPGKKSERQVMHVKKSLRKSHPKWSEDKIKQVAIATAWKSKNKKKVDENSKSGPDIKRAAAANPNIVKKAGTPVKKYTGLSKDPIKKAGQLSGGSLVKEAGLTSEAAEADRLAKLVYGKAPKLSADKAAHVVAELFQHKTGSPLDIDAAGEAASKYFGGPEKEDDDGGYASGKVTGGEEEAPEASGEEDIEGGEEAELGGEEGYSEDKELELIALIGKAVAKLLSMHRGAGLEIPDVEDGDDEGGEEGGEEGEGGGSTPPPFAKADSDDGGEEKTDDEEEGEEEEEEDDLDEAAYKVVSQNAVDTAKEDKARKIQTEPKVSENFKVQTGPSCRVAKDSQADPKNVRNPKLG